MHHFDTLEPEGLQLESSAPEQRTRMTRRVDGADTHVVKIGRGEQRAGLRREAEVLRAIGGSDVVRFVNLDDGPDATELVLRDTGGPSLGAALRDPATSPSVALGLLARTCDTVARLHHQGWAHGRIDVDHVLLTARGRIRLCSLGAASPIDIDPAAARADRIALLRIVDDWTRAPLDRRGVASILRRFTALLLERRTHRLADDPDPLLLGRILRRTARAGRLPTLPRPTHLRRFVAIALAVGAAAVAGWSLLPTTGDGSGDTDESPHVAAPPATPPSTTTVPTTTPAGATIPSTAHADPPDLAVPAGCTDIGPATPDIDGDGCGDSVRTDGNAVVVGDRRFRLGSDSDVVAVGDWDCDGVATPAVLRPATGAVHVFDRWATEDGPTTGRELGDVTGAVAFAPPSAECGGPRIITTSGATATVGGAGTP